MTTDITQKPADDFTEVLTIIEQARENAFRAVNRELISMYWEIGRYVSEKVKSEGWGKSVVQRFSQYIQSHFAGIKGFSPQNIWRMKRFYETYAGNEFLSTVLREIAKKEKLSTVSRELTEKEKLSTVPRELTKKEKLSTVSREIAEKEKLPPLVREIGWTSNVLIMQAAKTAEEREFYLLLAKKNNRLVP